MDRKNYTNLEQYGDMVYGGSFGDLTTFRVGGTYDALIYPKNQLALEELLHQIRKHSIPYKLIGKGSNLLCSDRHYEGLVIRLDKYFHSVFFDEESVTAQAGASIIALSYEAAGRGLSGLEFASGIPGTVGGAVFMNAGAYKSCVKDILQEVLVYHDGFCDWMAAEELQLDYRTSIFSLKPDWLILAARFVLKTNDPETINALMQHRRMARIANQPLEYPSAGSVFRNFPDQPAWQLLEGVGLRSYTIGGARFSEKHCNFIINGGKAKASDIERLMQEAKRRVREAYGIELIAEIERFNWDE